MNLDNQTENIIELANSINQLIATKTRDLDLTIERLRKALKFIDAVLGEGGSKGRPMDLIPQKEWKIHQQYKKECGI